MAHFQSDGIFARAPVIMGIYGFQSELRLGAERGGGRRRSGGKGDGLGGRVFVLLNSG